MSTPTGANTGHRPEELHHGLTLRDFLRVSTLGGAGIAAAASGLADLLAQTNPTGPGAIRFAVIGDFGETLANAIYPVDRVGEMIRSWNSDWVVTAGDNNYILGEAATIDVNIGKNFTKFIYPKTSQIPVQYPYPSVEPLYNLLIPCLGNHDYGDVFDDMIPTATNVLAPTPFSSISGTPSGPGRPTRQIRRSNSPTTPWGKRIRST